VTVSLFTVFLLCLQLVCAGSAMAERYVNQRFDFRVDVEDPDFSPLPMPANGDGMAFQSESEPDASILFFARNQLGEEDRIENDLARQTPTDAERVRTTLNRRDFYLEYDHQDLHTEVLTFLVRGVFHTGIAVAPIQKWEYFNQKFYPIFRSWKIHGNPTVY
jgi:hypothetical protein